MLRRHPFLITILWLASIGSAHAADPPACAAPVASREPDKPAPQPAAKPAAKEHKPGPADGTIDVVSDHVKYGVDGKGLLQGHVVITQGDREIRGDQVEIDKTGAVRTDSGIEYDDPLVNLTGQGGNYSPESGANFKSATFDLQERAGRGSADSLQLTPQGVLDLQGVKFTTCPASEESWRLHAKSVTLDTRTQIGSARSAYVEFEGVPILYLPWASFPLGNQRKSGFLFPTIGNNSRSGASIAAPYYWNILPNADLTFQPIVYSKRGADLGGDFRFMTSNDRGEITWNYLPYDSVFNAERSRLKVENALELPGNFRFTVDAQSVSDTHYFEDFAQGPEGTSTAFIPQQAAVTYRDENWRFDGQVQHYQTTDNTLPDFQRPYSRLPSLGVSAEFGLGSTHQLRYGFESEIVNFHRDIDAGECHAVLGQNVCVNGWRIDAMPEASIDFEGPGYFVRPGIAWRATQYELDNTDPGQDRSPVRTLPIASFDTGLQFERELGSHDQRRITLEPRMLYLYVPYRNQDQLPIFDTGLPDLDPVELFRTNRYVGADRVGDANQVSVGVTSRLLDAHDGRQFLSATLGQIYYFSNPRVLLPGEVPTIAGTFTPIPGEIPRTDNRSDFVAQLALTAFQDWSADLAVQWDPQNSQAERSEVNVQYKPKPDAVVNVGYRYQRDVLEQAEISGAWPISRSWNIFVRGIYSLKDDKPLERFAGFEYRACCWKVRLGGRSFVSNRTGSEDTGIYLQLELTGLASVGSESDSFLTEAIRGYAPAATQKLKGP